MKDYSFYKIKNNKDGYSYIGIAQTDKFYNGVKDRIVYHVGRYFDFLYSLKTNYRYYNPFRESGLKSFYGTLEELFDETLYGKGPFETKLSCMAASIAKYGWQNFTVELLATGYMRKPVAYAIENHLIELEYPNSYNQVFNNRTAEENEVKLMQQDWNRSQFMTYKDVEMKGFDLSGMSWNDVIDKICDDWDTLLDNIYS